MPSSACSQTPSLSLSITLGSAFSPFFFFFSSSTSLRTHIRPSSPAFLQPSVPTRALPFYQLDRLQIWHVGSTRHARSSIREPPVQTPALASLVLKIQTFVRPKSDSLFCSFCSCFFLELQSEHSLFSISFYPQTSSHDTSSLGSSSTPCRVHGLISLGEVSADGSGTQSTN